MNEKNGQGSRQKRVALGMQRGRRSHERQGTGGMQMQCKCVEFGCLKAGGV